MLLLPILLLPTLEKEKEEDGVEEEVAVFEKLESIFLVNFYSFWKGARKNVGIQRAIAKIMRMKRVEEIQSAKPLCAGTVTGSGIVVTFEL